MIFACAAAAAVTAASHSPSWFLNGAYHPPLPGRSSDNLLHAIGSANAQGGAAIDGEALTVALDVVQAWAVLLTLGFTLIIFVFLAFCVCSKKDDGYDEFEISHGITTVKICHDGGENGVSLIPRINGSGTLSMKATDETSEASSRYTLKRELPAIPTNSQENLLGKTDRPVSQHSSDLYASVSDSNQGASNVKLIGGVQVLPAGAIAPGGRAAVIKECISPPDSEQIEKGKKKKEKTEHAYAKVTAREGKEIEKSSFAESKAITLDKREKSSESRLQTTALKSEKRHEDVALPSSKLLFGQPRDSGAKSGVVTSPTTLTSVHSTFPPHSTTVCSPTSLQGRFPTSPNQPIPQPNIPAALAISGRQPANEEMPYMTPPILQPSRERDQQERYSGDSQDLRGYTSISVREPLAALKARQNEEGHTGRGAGLSGRGTGLRSGLASQGPEGEGYYMTVSDDSADEMYACIYEGSRGTGSETYAQIEPRTTPSSTQPPTSIQSQPNHPSSPSQLTRSQEQSPPAPPSVDSLRNVVHSRQASASSATSTGMGSPVAEKRGTRSPLPPLPQGDISLYSPPDPPIVSSQSVPKSPPKATAHFAEKNAPRSLEEMYAKVIKKGSGHSRGGSADSECDGKLTNSRRGSTEVAVSRWVSATSPIASKPSKEMTHSMVETRSHDVIGVSRVKSCDASGSWGGADKEGSIQLNRTSGNYESIPSQGGSLYSGSDPGYETVKNGEPPYASVGPSENYPGYETVRGTDVDSEEPGYETLKPKESEPGYETVAEISSKITASSIAGYESLINIGRSSSDFEPGYETVSSSLPSDPGYESVQEKSKIDNDPCYEELSHPHHPRTSSENDPNYEQLKFTSSRKSSEEGGDSGYEVVKKQVIEGNYELVSDYDTQEKSASSEQEVFLPQTTQVTPEIPLYASVKKRESPKKEKVESRDSFTKEDIDKSYKEDAALQNEKEVEILNDKKNDLLCDIDELITDLTKPLNPPISSEGMPAIDEIFDISFAPLSGAAQENAAISQIKEANMSDSKEVEDYTDNLNKSEHYQVMDSPEEVELPPPGEDGNMFVPEPLPSKSEQLMEQIIEKSTEDSYFSPQMKEDLGIDSTQSLVSLTFTAASPPTGSPEVNSPRSSASSTSSSKEEQKEPLDSKEDALSEKNIGETELVSAPPPPQFDEILYHSEMSRESSVTNNVDEPLPPPPLPILEDDIATASPPPPPPPLPDEMNPTQEFPLPPVSQDAVTNMENINGVSPTMVHSGVNDNFEMDEQTQPSSCYQVTQSPLIDSDMPPPPFFQSNEEDVTVTGSVNGGITVTVNPMAAIEDENVTAVVTLPSVSAAAVTIQHTSNGTNSHIAAIGTSSGESQSSGSTANGNGSVESVVTVDAKTGADPLTTVPGTTPAPSLQHSSSTSSSSSESKHSDPNEGITSV